MCHLCELPNPGESYWQQERRMRAEADDARRPKIEKRRVMVHRSDGPDEEYDERVVYDRGPEHSFRRILTEERRYPDGRIVVKDYP